jgi:serine/threonine protein kinase
MTMSHLHACRVVHRDLKPSKILLDCAFEPVVKLSTLAGFLDAVATADEEFMGNPLFMAPELVDHKEPKIGLPADAYAFAVLLYSMFALPAELDDDKPPPRIAPQLFS